MNLERNEIAESVVYYESAAEIWEKLEQRFGQANGSYELHGFPSGNGNLKRRKMNANGHEEENLMGEDSKEHESEQEKGNNTESLTKDQFRHLLSLLGKLAREMEFFYVGRKVKLKGENESRLVMMRAKRLQKPDHKEGIAQYYILKSNDVDLNENGNPEPPSNSQTQPYLNSSTYDSPFLYSLITSKETCTSETSQLNGNKPMTLLLD
ncbi:hypothetical protein AKJ16_DCAP00128 [Drosera capensis]